jgi:predicted peroxiredoxin
VIPTNQKEDDMSDKVLINLSTGLEDPERVTVAFLVAGAAVEQGREVKMFLTKEAVRLALPGVASAVACDGCPPLARLYEQYASGGGELLACPVCVNSRGLAGGEMTANARVAGATPLWEWIGSDNTTVLSY